ncbi:MULTISPECIES: ATP synthase F1 subunit delta [unclassified Candidatus Tisiphia]|jgi:F-type H+-transporting ATPase subunit delta|uniref:ATP synthase F1 subunit delta n=1 Tax=unclassified Candidatus Tisiphia TaxID=2996318 RepID=UPI0025CA0C82|nr:ATP synthase F1 subunit delta [Candidatus Tisiphia sp.]
MGSLTWFVFMALCGLLLLGLLEFYGCNSIMINNKLVQNYTSALFNNALANALEDKIFEQIKIIDQLINDNAQIKEAIFSPIVKNIDKCKIIELIAKNFNVESTVKQLLLILLKHSRMPILSNIVVLYQQLLNKSRNIKMVTITSAKILHSEEKQWLTKHLETDFQQKVAIKFSQNQSIIGGIIIQYDSVVRDYSIDGMLKKIIKTLKTTKI